MNIKIPVVDLQQSGTIYVLCVDGKPQKCWTSDERDRADTARYMRYLEVRHEVRQKVMDHYEGLNKERRLFRANAISWDSYLANLPRYLQEVC